MRDGTGRWGRVLLLGGTSEIGLAILHELELQMDAEILLAGRDLDALRSVPLPTGTRRACMHWDARQPGSGSELARAAAAGGDIDLVIAAAGVLGDQATVITTNFTGLVEALLPLSIVMTGQGHGTIVVLSSVAAVRARKANYVYGSSKAGLDAFAQGLADDLTGTGVRVLLVRPGFVVGRMTSGMPTGPLATTPRAVAQAVRRGLEGRQPTVWIPAPTRVLAVAMRMVPRVLWRRLKS